MLTDFKTHIDAAFPFLKEKKLVVACSGGMDSTVLAHLCAKSKVDMVLAHCNFKLRGNESDADAIFVQQLAEKLQVECFTITFNTLEEAKKQRGSVQMIARKLRYNWFEVILKEHKHDFILTAHHADDALETMLINLSRGTGIDGLVGIPEINGKVVRPLLPFSRQQIKNYAQHEKLSWREDSSNSDTKYIRNKIRKEIVPKMKELHPTFLENTLRTQQNLFNSKLLLAQSIREKKEQIFHDTGKYIQIGISDLRKLEPLHAHLYALFQTYGFSESDEIEKLMCAISGKELHSRTHRLLKDRENLLLQEKQVPRASVFVLDDKAMKIEAPVGLLFESTEKLEETSKNVVHIDKEKLNYPLTLRKWRKGDYFYPAGMHGKKKLSKFFKDEKMDVFSKERQWLLCSTDEIVWVIGKRLDERFKVEPTTTQILKVTFSL
nr:tRNA lysidine(34) synthetase TilS [uncultured Allomuricauda sp.]